VKIAERRPYGDPWERLDGLLLAPDRALRVGAGALGDRADHLAGRRARGLERRAAFGVDLRASDPHPHVLAHPTPS
jgi:hypothetical protein